MDFSKSTLLIAAFVSTFLIGFLTASTVGATHQNLYQTTMMAPVQADWVPAKNTCGWHSGDCRNNNNGSALDWGAGNGTQWDTNVRFRGWFYRSNTSFIYGHLMINVFQSPGGGTDACDEAVADLIEIATGQTRYGMKYMRTYKAFTGWQGLYVSGSGIGAWNSPVVTYMIDEGTGCPWTGYHAHTYAVPVAVTYYTENRAAYPCCNYGGALYYNAVETHLTHRIQFWQGH